MSSLDALRLDDRAADTASSSSAASDDDDSSRGHLSSVDSLGSNPESSHHSPERHRSPERASVHHRDEKKAVIAAAALAADAEDDDFVVGAPAMRPLPHLTGKRVLLTGGAGFIGSHVAEVLLARGDEVLIVDEVNDYYDVRLKRANLKRLQERWGTERLRVYEGDVCDEPFISAIFEEEEPKWVVHLAARAGVRPSIQDPFIYIHSNVEATTRLMELARKHGNEHFVFASSSSVYGGSKNEVFSEADVVDFPVSPYAATKKACELMSYTYHHLYGMNVAGLRFFTVYGPRGRPDMAPFKFVDRVSRGVEIQQFGDGSSSRDYTYIDDIVDGVVRSLDRPLGYQIYNLGNGNPVGLKHFISIVERATGKKANIRVLPDQPGDVPRTAADISKARRLLGYEPKVAFADGIQRLAEWYRTDYASLEEQPPETVLPIAKSTSMVSFALGSHNEAGIL